MLPQGTVRINFTKTGKIKYISHLDLCRTMKSAFIRSGIPIWYTEGFNPRPKMVFALTVSVGSESLCEFLDIKLTRTMDEKEFISRLQSALTSDISIKKVYPPQTKMTELASCTYTVELEEEITQEFVDTLRTDPMIVMKHGKKGDIPTDIRPMILEAVAEGKTLKLHLTAEQSNYLNPEYVMKAIASASDGKYDFYRITRTACFRADGKPFM